MRIRSKAFIRRYRYIRITPLAVTMISSIAVLYLLFAVVSSNSTSTVFPVPAEKLTCMYLQQPLCRNAGYNATAFPNSRQHETQDEASSEMADFSQLWTGETPCSNAIVHLLCSFYFPFCGLGEQGENTTLQPCRSLCEEARSGCEEYIEKHAGLRWPTFLDCSIFAEDLCFGPPDPSVLTIPGGELSTTAPASTVVAFTTERSYMLTPSLTLITSNLLLLSGFST